MTLSDPKFRNKIKSTMLMKYTCYNELGTSEVKLKINNLEIKENSNYIFTHNCVELDYPGQIMNFHLYYSVKK